MPFDLKKDIKIERGVKLLKNKEKSTKTVFDFLNREISFSGNRLKDTKKEQFYSELGIMLSSGIDLKSSLDIVIDQQKKESDRKLFQSIKEKILLGESFSEALYQTGKFSPYEYYSLKIGEESGRLNDVLTEINRYYSTRIKQKRQLTSMLSYPILVLVVAVAAVLFMMNVIVPMFSEVFKRFGGELPAITRFIIDASVFFQNNFFWLVLFVAAMVLFMIGLRKKEGYRRYSSALILKLPVIGNLINTLYLARFCQSMAFLTASHTPMLKAIDLVKKMLNFYPYDKALTIVENDILHGKLLNESLAQFPLFDKRIVYLTKVAEEVNQIDTIYSKLHLQYTEEIEHKVSVLSSLMEPLLIIFVGLLVMVILISMYLPLFQLSTTVF